MKLLLLIATLSVAYAIDIKPFVEQENEQLFKYNPSDEYTLPADIDDIKPAVHFSGNEKFAKTLDSENKNQGQGKFKYSLHTQNGIELNQVGKLKDENTFVVSGSYSYTGADGKKYRVRYTADEYGYHPITELDVDIPEPDSGFQLLKQKLPYGGDSSIGDGYSYNPPEEPTNEYLPPETPSRGYLPASY